ncbi:MAG: CDP-glycerol glycerophosphotransferase family protein, partial [Propionibacteriaceae bacterium]|nr:CDP-glycerol glycerophosphotransferase family protein [Propionibacteriaceae bacterium]
GVFSWLVNLTSVVALLLLLAGVPGWIPVVVWAIGLANSGWQARQNPPWMTESLGSRSIVRITTVIGAGVLAADSGRLDTLAWISLAALAAAIVTESPLRQLDVYIHQGTKGLQDLDADPRSGPPLGLLFPLSMVTALLGAISALAGISWIPFAVLTVANVALLAVGVIGCLRDLAAGNARRSALTRALRRHKPSFVLYWRADPGTAYQISMWLPYLERLGKPFIVVVRTLDNFLEAAELTDRPVLLRRRLPELDDIIVPSIRTVFYVNNAAANTHMVRFPGLNHIMLNHGDSDKAPSFNPVSRMYDRNFVAGQAAIDRFASNNVAVPEGQLVIVGRPQVEPITKATGPIGQNPHPYVLNAPTWAGFTADAQYSSLNAGLQLVNRLIERGCNVIFRPHPYAYRTPAYVTACRTICAALAADQRPDADHRYGAAAETELSIIDCSNLSDAMVSDVSSVASDYLQSEKPLALTVVHVGPEEYVKEFPLAQGAYLLTVAGAELPNLDECLDGLLSTDPLAETRRKLRTYYLGDAGDDPYLELFLREARKYT